jgi:hypothetical protein
MLMLHQTLLSVVVTVVDNIWRAKEVAIAAGKTLQGGGLKGSGH